MGKFFEAFKFQTAKVDCIDKATCPIFLKQSAINQSNIDIFTIYYR